MAAARILAAMGLLSCLLPTLFGCQGEPAFMQKDGVWHYRTATITGSDAASFKVLSDQYAKDRNRVYWGDSYREGREYFMIRHDRVTVVKDADPASFRVMEQDYARDATRMFYEGAQFAVKHVDSFQVLDYGFARDNQSGYYLRTPIAGSDGASFAVLDSRYARDKSRVFYCTLDSASQPRGPAVRAVALRGVDPAAFTVLEMGYAKTATAVYFNGNAVAGAHAPSFETPGGLADSADARDKDGPFQQGRRLKPAAP
jgi:hypothetical protein